MSINVTVVAAGLHCRKPFSGTILLEVSVGRDFGALKGLRTLGIAESCTVLGARRFFVTAVLFVAARDGLDVGRNVLPEATD